MTSAAEHVVEGFADELEKLAFPDQLEKLALFGLGKKVPAPPPTSEFGKVWQGIKDSKFGKMVGKPLKVLFSAPAMMAFGAAGGLGLLGEEQREQRHAQNMGMR